MGKKILETDKSSKEGKLIPEYQILSPEDNLLQVALHTAKHSYVRAPGFRLHSDVDRIVCFQEINWNIFGLASNKITSSNTALDI